MIRGMGTLGSVGSAESPAVGSPCGTVPFCVFAPSNWPFTLLKTFSSSKVCQSNRRHGIAVSGTLARGDAFGLPGAHLQFVVEAQTRRTREMVGFPVETTVECGALALNVTVTK